MGTTGWLTSVTADSYIVQVYDFYWNFREIGWTFKGRRWTYYQRREMEAQQRTWVGLNEDVAKTKASGELASTPSHTSDDVTLRARAVRTNDAGAYAAQATHFVAVDDWTTYYIAVHDVGDV